MVHTRMRDVIRDGTSKLYPTVSKGLRETRAGPGDSIIKHPGEVSVMFIGLQWCQLER